MSGEHEQWQRRTAARRYDQLKAENPQLPHDRIVQLAASYVGVPANIANEWLRNKVQ